VRADLDRLRGPIDRTHRCRVERCCVQVRCVCGRDGPQRGAE
jgi:hypothetical protein